MVSVNRSLRARRWRVAARAQVLMDMAVVNVWRTPVHAIVRTLAISLHPVVACVASSTICREGCRIAALQCIERRLHTGLTGGFADFVTAAAIDERVTSKHPFDVGCNRLEGRD